MTSRRPSPPKSPAARDTPKDADEQLTVKHYMKTIPIALALLPLALLLLFYSIQQAKDNANPQAPSNTPRKLTEEKPTRKVIALDTKAIEKKREEIGEKIREHERRAADMLTDKLQDVIINSQMRRLEPSYRAAMADWGIDSASTTNILAIVRTREVGLLSLRKKFDQEGTSYAAQFRKEQSRLMKTAEDQIVPIVGDGHYHDLVRLDTESRPKPAD